MKKIKRPITTSLTLILLVILTCSCGRTMQFQKNPDVAAATGKIRVKPEKNGNYAINVKVFNLASPQDLRPSKSTYVVWSQTSQNETKNLGQLKSKSPMFSKALQASLKTVSTFKPVRIFITAEDNATIEYPGTQTVLSTATYN